MDIDYYEDEMLLDEDEFIAPSPTGEEHYEEGIAAGGGRFGGNTRQPNVKVIDRNFFNGKSFAHRHFSTIDDTIQWFWWE
ncbi:hypothetical protein BGZ65_005774 [Modicella reniformis]|uniref:Uncharacterized protein n=1 Tax=Modicella reniformis TaxID=1440133 RepID=A0A9P6MBG4_9FUNG|nr:hypothetical protein BGZ65_005774 [Modicella reniformis]